MTFFWLGRTFWKVIPQIQQELVESWVCAGEQIIFLCVEGRFSQPDEQRFNNICSVIFSVSLLFSDIYSYSSTPVFDFRFPSLSSQAQSLFSVSWQCSEPQMWWWAGGDRVLQSLTLSLNLLTEAYPTLGSNSFCAERIRKKNVHKEILLMATQEQVSDVASRRFLHLLQQLSSSPLKQEGPGLAREGRFNGKQEPRKHRMCNGSSNSPSGGVVYWPLRHSREHCWSY